ncbi:MAG: hypothetical protein COB07_00405 [Sulfurovum sp.]|nr:MAG: hypothetical protein COB07_00405 [Sulfurovum sp.]
MGKTRLVIGATVLLSGILLTGCGADTPEDVAKTFANALSSADIDEAKEVSTENTQKEIDRLVGACNESYYSKLTDEAAKAFNILNSKESSRLVIETKMNEIMNDPDMKKEMEEMMKSLTEQYGDVKKLPKEKQKELGVEMMEKFTAKYIKPVIGDIVDTLKIELDHPDEVKDILTKFIMTESMGRRNRFMSKRDVILQIVRDGNFENFKNVTPECVAKYTQYDFIDSINFIEVENESADEAVVRLELIDNKDKSSKVSVDVEKIKDEWKVSSLSLDMW